MSKNILGMVGSLRAGSFNRALWQAAVEAMGQRATTQLADLGSLPHYNADLDGEGRPAGAQAFIEQVTSADALLIEHR